MKNRWKELVVGGLTGVVAGVSLDMAAVVGRRVSRGAGSLRDRRVADAAAPAPARPKVRLVPALAALPAMVGARAHILRGHRDARSAAGLRGRD
jgi:hypothetical protein